MTNLRSINRRLEQMEIGKGQVFPFDAIEHVIVKPNWVNGVLKEPVEVDRLVMPIPWKNQ